MQSDNFEITVETEPVQRRKPIVWSRILLGVIGLAGIFFGFVAWAVSSPVGGSPDDDYHLGSIWCPWPVDGSGCELKVVDGEVVAVEVPDPVALAAHCHALRPEVGAQCTEQLDDALLSYTGRFDDGTYPPGYYKFHHLFVGSDVFHSVIAMRIANLIIGLGGIALVGLFAAPRFRHIMLLAAGAAWVPMGVYFIASNNPTSWALSGCFIYGAAMISAAQSEGWRRWVLLALMTGGAVMAATSRADSAFYLLVIALAVWCLVPLNRSRIVPFLWSCAAALFGLVMFKVAGQSGNLTGSGGWPVDEGTSFLGVVFRNLLSLPEWFVGLWGLGGGPGWLNIRLSGWSTYVMILVFGGLLFAGAQKMFPRKALASIIAFGALVGIPVVSMALRHVHPLTYFQARYVLPLLAIFLMIWLAQNRGRPIFSSVTQSALFVGAVSIANAAALYAVVERYSTGTGPDPDLANFWWPWLIPPMGVVTLGSLAMAAGLSCLMALTLPRQNNKSRLAEIPTWTEPKAARLY